MRRIVYVADTSMWIHLVKFYPAAVFPSLVQRCEGMIEDQRLISPHAVLGEIHAGNDEVVAWADMHEGAFVVDSGTTVERAEKIQREHPSLGGSAGGRDLADPYLIALAISIKEGIGGGSLPVIVTEESPRSGKKIPQMAGKYDIDSCNTVGMFEREGWAF